MISTYINPKFTKHITTKIDTIIECGSRDCLDAIEMLNFYKPKVIYSFECNPDSIKVCEANIVDYNTINLIKKAVSNTNDTITFYATDMEKSKDKNIGASSVLYHLDNKENFIQKEISVPAVRLDKFIFDNNIEEVDLLCFDLQGYERFAVEGMGDEIKKVKYIISEVSFRSFYNNDQLFNDYVKLLSSKGFQLVETMSYGDFGDSLFKNIELV
jgi:FkbM family methyltransferase